MGTSFVDYRGGGFWASDGAIEIWLRLLIREIDSRAPVPSWLAELREHWREQATFGGVGSLHFALDDFIIDDTRRQIVLSVAEGALVQLAQYGEIITRDELNELTSATPDAYWTRDVPSDTFAAMGNAFIALLNGAITTTAATAPVMR